MSCAQVDSPTYATSYFDPRGDQEHRFALPAVPYLKLAVVHDEAAHALNVFALNRSLDQELALEVEARSFDGLRLAQALTMRNDDLEATNTREAPERVVPVALEAVRVEGGTMRATLRPASWNVVCLADTVQP